MSYTLKKLFTALFTKKDGCHNCKYSETKDNETLCTNVDLLDNPMLLVHDDGCRFYQKVEL